MSEKGKNAEKWIAGTLTVLFLSWVVVHDHQQQTAAEQQLSQVNAALNRLNASLEQLNTLQTRQVSLGEQSVGVLTDTRNAVVEMKTLQSLQAAGHGVPQNTVQEDKP